MSEGKKSSLASGPEVIRAAATEAVEILSDQLLMRAKDDGGSVTALAIRDVVEKFKAQPDAILAAVYE